MLLVCHFINYVLAQIISRIALLFLGREWASLKGDILRLYDKHSSERHYRPSWLLQALLLSGEDHRFFFHNGIDFYAICRALWRGTVLRRKEGASTIEMQLVRILTGRYERTFGRKIKEIAMATLVHHAIPKDVLPSLYIHAAYFGWRMNGFSAACRRLHLNPTYLSQSQAATLIARLKYPEPMKVTAKREKQITARGKHLIALHQRHMRQNVYTGLRLGVQYAAI